MPKVKWGGDLSPDAINNAERREGGEFMGKIPPKGVYRFKLRFSKKDQSSSGNPKLTSLLVLDGSWKPEHRQYDGCPLWDHMPVTAKTAWRVRAYCDALGITAEEFMGKMVIDDEGNVQKIGKLVIADKDLLVKVSVKPDKPSEYGDRLTLANGYLPLADDEDDEDGDGGGEDDDDDADETGDDPF